MSKPHWGSNPFALPQNGSTPAPPAYISSSEEEELIDFNNLGGSTKSGRSGGNQFSGYNPKSEQDEGMDVDEEDEHQPPKPPQRTTSLNSNGALNHHPYPPSGSGPSSPSPFDIPPPQPKPRANAQQIYPSFDLDSESDEDTPPPKPQPRHQFQGSTSQGGQFQPSNLTPKFTNTGQNQFNFSAGIKSPTGIQNYQPHRNSSQGVTGAMHYQGQGGQGSSSRFPGTNQPTSPTSSTSSNYAFGARGGAASVPTYESESDDDTPTHSSVTKTTGKKPTGSQPPKPSTSAPTGKYGTTPQLITNGADLKLFGAWDKLQSTDKVYKLLTTYVKNSCGFKTSSAKVHGILERKGKKSSNTSSNQLLLWFKTTPGSIKHLSQGSPGAISFFDRVARAYSVRPSDIKKSHRQIILLCSVSLGNMYESDHGYQTWSKTAFPVGFDSVKANGKLMPNPQENQVLGFTIVPSGVTATGKSKLSLDYSEYIIRDSARVDVKYAVDLEITPPK